MYSGLRKLGESQESDEDVQDMDFEEVTENYLSPDSGYPQQRLKNYDVELAQHQTLNGVGAWFPTGGIVRAARGRLMTPPPVSTLPATFKGNFLDRAMGPTVRTAYGHPRTPAVVNPRTSYMQRMSPIFRPLGR